VAAALKADIERIHAKGGIVEIPFRASVVSTISTPVPARALSREIAPTPADCAPSTAYRSPQRSSRPSLVRIDRMPVRPKVRDFALHIAGVKMHLDQRSLLRRRLRPRRRRSCLPSARRQSARHGTLAAGSALRSVAPRNSGACLGGRGRRAGAVGPLARPCRPLEALSLT
jgi:hypothetical protein